MEMSLMSNCGHGLAKSILIPGDEIGPMQNN